jgi:hypothetical protein
VRPLASSNDNVAHAQAIAVFDDKPHSCGARSVEFEATTTGAQLEAFDDHTRTAADAQCPDSFAKSSACLTVSSPAAVVTKPTMNADASGYSIDTVKVVGTFG